MRPTIAAIAAALSQFSTGAAMPSGQLPRNHNSTPQTSPNLARQSPLTTQGGAYVSGTGITSVSGTFRVPNPSAPLDGPTANDRGGFYSASIWVGIGGVGSCPKTGAAMRAGLELNYDRLAGNSLPPFAWYEYGVPGSGNGAFAFVGFSAGVGDLIRITVTAGASGPEDAVIENFGKVDSTAGRTALQRATPTFGLGAGPGDSGAEFCRSEAGWAVEAFPLVGTPDTPAPLANFTDITFGELNFKAGSGAAQNAAAAKLLNIEIEAQGGKLTDCKSVAADKVLCKRVLYGQ